MRHKPLIAKQKYRLNRRLIIFSLIFVFFTFITALLHQLSMWNVLPQYTFIPNFLFYPLVISFFIAFIDIILYFLIILTLEALGLIAVVYAFSFTGLYHFSLSDFGNNIHTAVLSVILLIIDVLWYFGLFPRIHALFSHINNEWAGRTASDDNYEEPNNEPAEREPETMHTKEELARLLNLWQQKYAQATTDEGRKEANEMILKYTTELEKLKVVKRENGTTPERAKLDKGGGNE